MTNKNRNKILFGGVSLIVSDIYTNVVLLDIQPKEYK